MNYCPDCEVWVEDCLARCPLCGRQLTGTPAENPMYPVVSEKEFIDRRSYAGDLMVFFTLLFIGGSVVINMLFWNGTPWFLSVAAAVLYVWILVGGTIVSDMFAGKKVLLQIVGIMGMVLAFDFTAGWTGWSVEYVLPFLLIAGIVYIDLYAYIHKSHWRDNLLYAAILVLMGCVPLILYFAGVTRAPAPMILSTVASAVTILGMLRFALRRLGGELRKRLHF